MGGSSSRFAFAVEVVFLCGHYLAGGKCELVSTQIQRCVGNIGVSGRAGLRVPQDSLDRLHAFIAASFWDKTLSLAKGKYGWQIPLLQQNWNQVDLETLYLRATFQLSAICLGCSHAKKQTFSISA